MMGVGVEAKAKTQVLSRTWSLNGRFGRLLAFTNRGCHPAPCVRRSAFYPFVFASSVRFPPSRRKMFHGLRSKVTRFGAGVGTNKFSPTQEVRGSPLIPIFNHFWGDWGVPPRNMNR